jgi:hypothetical protein
LLVSDKPKSRLASGFTGPIIFVPLSLGDLAVGVTLALNGLNLSTIESISLGGEDAKVTVISDIRIEITIPEIAPGNYNLKVESSLGGVIVEPTLSVVRQSQPELQVIVKRVGQTRAKIWAKNVIGQGKIQFKFNGQEVAWVRAIDGTNPKLRLANGSYYLVRTIDLDFGNNALEVFSDADRIRRVVYSN